MGKKPDRRGKSGGVDRRRFVEIAGTAAAGLCAGIPSSLRAATAPPNVLLVLVDQMRHDKWTPDLKTPHLDRIRSKGVSFQNHFVSASPCSPSRACLFTGTVTTQNKMFTNCDFVEGDRQPSLDRRIPTLGHIFQNAGYQTPYRGKWHLTREKELFTGGPLSGYGFTGWKHPDALFGGNAYCGAVQDPLYAKWTCDWLKNPDNHKRPWFLVSSLVNPHDICEYPLYYPQHKLRQIRTDEPPPNWTDDLSGKPAAQREFQKNYETFAGKMDLDDPVAWRRYLDFYMRCIEDMDENLGDILDALEESGQADNTIVVFMADHGEMAGSHRLRTKGSFAYEEEINVPLVVSWPGKIPQGVTTLAFAANIDVMPTLLALAGIDNRNYMAGVSQAETLFNPSATGPRDHVVFHQDWEMAVKIGKDPEEPIMQSPAHVRCLRDREWKYAYYFSPYHDGVEHELYNLQDDPLEMDNLARDPGHKARMKSMHEFLFAKEKKFEDEFELP
jgi:arylsulfatase